MSKKLLQTVMALVMANLAAYKDMFDDDLHMQQPDSEPRPILKSQPKKEYCSLSKANR